MLNTDFSLWAKQINIFTYKYSIMQVKYCLKFVKKSKFVIAKVKEISWNEQKKLDFENLKVPNCEFSTKSVFN